MAGPPKALCFTVAATGILRDLRSSCEVLAAPPAPGQTPSQQYTGLWDTGASASVITADVAKFLGLYPVAMMNVTTAHGTKATPAYVVWLGLPMGVVIGPLQVTVGHLPGFDVLIGMDVITAGDFALTNVGGKDGVFVSNPRIRSDRFCEDAHCADAEDALNQCKSFRQGQTQMNGAEGVPPAVR